MSERMTRKQALERIMQAVAGETGWRRLPYMADLLLAVQSEAEERITFAWSETVQGLERQVENLTTDLHLAATRVFETEARVATECAEIAAQFGNTGRIGTSDHAAPRIRERFNLGSKP